MLVATKASFHEEGLVQIFVITLKIYFQIENLVPTVAISVSLCFHGGVAPKESRSHSLDQTCLFSLGPLGPDVENLTDRI